MTFREKIDQKEALIGVIGLGYVGLPLVLRFWEMGFPVLGFDTDRAKVDHLNRGESYIKHIPSSQVAEMVAAEGEGPRFAATHDMARLSEPDALLICVPTPLTPPREPDLKYVENTTRDIAHALRPGQLVSLESTTYPGTTVEVLLPLLSKKLTGGPGLFPGLFAGAGGPGQPLLPRAQHPQGGGGHHARLPGKRGGPVQPGGGPGGAGVIHPGGGDDQAPGEHLPVGEHRPHQRTQGAVPAHGAGRLRGHRGLPDQALRVPGLLPRAGPGWALHPHRPLLPDLEGPSVRSFHPLHRAGRRSQCLHAVFCGTARRRCPERPGQGPQGLQNPGVGGGLQKRRGRPPGIPRVEDHLSVTEKRGGGEL